jgi:hypothetical protein
MKILFAFILFFAACIFKNKPAFCQKNKQKQIDSVLEANSKKWKIKLHRGMFGMAKPEFGPYLTVSIKKLDSPVFKKKTKEGSYSGAIISSEGWDWDFGKYQSVEKRKAYQMLFAGESDTTKLVYSIYRISKEKTLTFLGELMSKDDEGKNITLGYKTNISGIILTSYDTVPWRFFIEDSFSREEETFVSGIIKTTSIYLVAGNDSLFTEPIMQNFGNPGNKYFWQFQTGIYINTLEGTHIAALKFGTPGDISNPFYAWIRNDAEPTRKEAIASVFALLISTTIQ